jgi:hypothetical protein
LMMKVLLLQLVRVRANSGENSWSQFWWFLASCRSHSSFQFPVSGIGGWWLMSWDLWYNLQCLSMSDHDQSGCYACAAFNGPVVRMTLIGTADFIPRWIESVGMKDGTQVGIQQLLRAWTPDRWFEYDSVSRRTCSSSQLYRLESSANYIFWNLPQTLNRERWNEGLTRTGICGCAHEWLIVGFSTPPCPVDDKSPVNY